MSSRGTQGNRGRGRGRGGNTPFRPRGGYGGGSTGGGEYGGGQGGSRGGYGGYGGHGGTASGAVAIGPAAAPDATVSKIENALQGKGGKPNLKGTFPGRPGYGTKGAEVVLWANYVVLTAAPQLVLYRYDISAVPAATGRKLTQVVRLLLETPELAPHKDNIVTDFKSTLLARTRLADQAVTVPYRAEGEDEPRTGATQYQVQLRFTNVLEVDRLVEYLKSTDVAAHYDDKLPMIQAFNIFFNHYAKSSRQLATIGKSKIFAAQPSSASSWDLGNCLTALRGFFVSVRVATARVLVNVNVSHAAFYQAVPLDQMMLQFGSQRGMRRLESFLKRLRVQTTHLKPKTNRRGEVVPRIKTVFGFATADDGHDLAHPPRVHAFAAGPKDVQFWLDAPGSDAPQKDAPPASTKPKKGGKKGGSKAKSQPQAAAGGRYISVYDFFVNIINAGNQANPTYLPAQVCNVLPGQPANSKLDPTQTQQMIKFAVRSPRENMASILGQGLQTAGLTASTNPRLGQFGMTTSSNLITVHGRVLVGPRVVYRQDKQAKMVPGGWNMVPSNMPSLKFSTGGSMKSWSCLYIDMPAMYPNAHRFPTIDALNGLLQQFTHVLEDCGMTVAEPLPPQRAALAGTDDPQLDGFFKKAATSLQLLLVVLPATPIPLYNRIKKLGDVTYGLHTVCTVGTKLAKGQDQYLRNVALKCNLKLGGSNQRVESARLGFLTEDKTMVVGIDVTHPSPGSSARAPSVAGMVASIDRWLGQWPGILRIQAQARQEMVAHLDEMLKSRLQLWRTLGRHLTLPENILIYRDGVSEGQYQLVVDDELPRLRAACHDVYSAQDQAKGLPRLTLVVVGKRHHTRFYPTAPDQADRSGNTKPGTMVDRGVTEARSWDFFLQAHAALQGTARPAHYYVLLDEIFRSKYPTTTNTTTTTGPPNVADRLQDLTQSMCYVFGRATKAVSYCTPAYYADILCERARCYLSNLFDKTPDPSTTAPSSVAGSVGGADAPSQQDIQIHANLKNSMFYL